MHWSVTLAFVAVMGANAPQATEFDSYSKAYRTASESHRPMLVILNGDDNQSVSLDALQKNDDAREVLENYVVAVIDTTTEEGQKDYELFGKPTLPRTVVIDERQEKQVFRTSDTMRPETLTSVLQQYRDGVPATVTAARPVVSQPAAGSLNYYQSGAGSCPNCRKF